MYILLCFFTFVFGEDVRLTLSNGSPVVGRVVRSPGVDRTEVVEFLGIPFAEPMVGKLRFEKPIPKKPWKEDRQCTKLPNACMQNHDETFGDNFSGTMMWNPNTNVSEDCLYLNVWIPRSALQKRKKLPVFFWIYGGGFWSGSSALKVYDAKILATVNNVIVVSVNYRLTVFGFLYLQQDNIAGNQGLWDQLLALKWTRDNIAQFSGNPDEVTLVGESAGAASASYHLISPRSRGLFKRVILQSSTALAPWAVRDPVSAQRIALHVAGAAHCGTPPPEEFEYVTDADWIQVRDCLTRLTPAKVLDIEWVTYAFCDFPWVPVIDGDFIPAHPATLVRTGQINDADILLGANLDESMYFIVYHVDDVFKKDLIFVTTEFINSDEIFKYAAKKLLPQPYWNSSIVQESILHQYTDYELPGNAERRQRQLDRMLGDLHFTCPVISLADQSVWNATGVLHGYEIEFVFGAPLDPSLKYTPDEIELSRRMMRYWTNFASTGDPNIGPNGRKSDDPVWPQYDLGRKEYLILDSRSRQNDVVDTGLRDHYCRFWNDYMPRLIVGASDILETEQDWKRNYDKWLNLDLPQWEHVHEQYVRQQDLKSGIHDCSN